MEKLKAKDLTIHLNNNLRIVTGDETKPLIGLTNDKAEIQGKYFKYKVPIASIRPLVRPPDQLIQRIRHGDTFFEPYKLLRAYNRIGYHFNMDREQLEAIIKADQLDFGKMPYWMVVMSAKWNFDVTHLLARDLADPISDL